MDPRQLRRLPPYVYVQDLVRGRRVLEVGCGDGDGAHFLLQAGARAVTGVDRTSRVIEAARTRYRVANLEFRVSDPGALELEDRSFDVVCVPSGAELVRRLGFLEEVRRVLVRDGLLVVCAASADRPDARGGISYHELVGRLEPLFGGVRMIGVSPFLGLSLVEFGDDGGEVPELELDTSLLSLGGGDEAVVAYVAITGRIEGAARGFTVVQMPSREGVAAIGEVVGAPAAAGGGAADARLHEAEVLAADAIARLRELEQEMAQVHRRQVGRGDEAELRRRLAKAVKERTGLEVELAQTRTRLNEAEIEIGRVAGQAAHELNQARAEAATAAARITELEAQLATARRENLALREELDAHAAQVALGTVAEARARATGEPAEVGSPRDTLRMPAALVPPASAGEAAAPEPASALDPAELARLELALREREADLARVTSERQELTWRVEELEGRLHALEAAAPAPSPAPSLASADLLAEAALRHEHAMREKRIELEERDAYIAELRDELDRAARDVEETRAAAAAARAQGEALAGELRELRSRAARAEGELLRLRTVAADASAAPAAAPAPAAPAAAAPASAAPAAPAPAEGDRVAELDAALAKANARWREAEAKSDELWRKIGEMQRELEQNREQAVENARMQRQAAQVALTRAMEEASKKLVSVQDQLGRTERERQELERAAAELKPRVTAAERERDAAVQILSLFGARLGELDDRLAELDRGLLSEEARLGELEDSLRTVHHHTALVPDSTELERELVERAQAAVERERLLAARDERIRELMQELGQRDGEIAVLHAGVADARRRVSELIDGLRRTRDQMSGRSIVEIAAMLDRLAAEATDGGGVPVPPGGEEPR